MRMTLLTACTAASIVRKVARIVDCTGGFGTRRRMIRVMTARVPSDPTSKCVRS